MVNSTVRVPTPKASRYLQQLCKHWSHNLAVEFTAETGKVVFPRNARGADWPGDATLVMQANDDGLECRLEASAAGQLDERAMSVTHHPHLIQRHSAVAQLSRRYTQQAGERTGPKTQAHKRFSIPEADERRGVGSGNDYAVV